MNAKQKVHNANLNKWIAIFQKQASSGKTIREWCAENDISFHAYYYWKRIAKDAYLDSFAQEIVPLPVPVSDPNSPQPNAQVPAVSQNFSDSYNFNNSRNSHNLCDSYKSTEVISVSIGDISISIGAEASDELITRMIGAIRHA